MYTQIFDLESDLLKAIAHPKRLEIIHLLRDEELCVSDIHTMLDLPQANISQHLLLMKMAGVLQAKKRGKQVYYSVADSRILQVCDLMRQLLIDNNQGGRLADQLTIKMSDLVPVVHDPVCRMRVSPKTAAYVKKHAGTTYYFCASGCYKKFITHPKSYLK